MTDSIPWWAWIAIWGGLVLALLVMLGLFAWWLFRKSLRLLDDLADLAERSAVLDIEQPELARPAIAILQQASEIRAREDARRYHRHERRRVRRERRMARARRITTVDASTQQWPADWYR